MWKKWEKKKGKKETSKVILFSVLSISLIFLVAVIIAWIIYDRSEAAAMAAIFMAPALVAYTCYTNKAKAENLLKIRKNVLRESKEFLSEERHQEILMDSSKDFLSSIGQQITNLHNVDSKD